MPITNLDKPASGTPETNLNIGDGYRLLIGGVFHLIIGAQNLLAGITNSSKTSSGETWGTIATTWASESRTWLAVSQLIANNSKPSASITNASKPV